jgi:hypothetical protein
MATVATYSMQPGLPAFWSADLQCRPVSLPYGGPTGAGGPFVQMSALSLVNVAAQPEIWVITPSGSGTFTMQFTDGYGTQVATTAVNATTGTAAQVLASLQTIFPTWMLPTGSVTGSAGGPWTVTFGGNYRVGGSLQLVTTTGTGAATYARSQRGSVGAGQYDVYDGVTYTTVNALLKDGLNVGISGGLATTPYGPINDETWPAVAFIAGYFLYSAIPNITTGAVAAGNVPGLTWQVGSSAVTAGAIVKLNQ